MNPCGGSEETAGRRAAHSPSPGFPRPARTCRRGSLALLAAILVWVHGCGGDGSPPAGGPRNEAEGIPGFVFLPIEMECSGPTIAEALACAPGLQVQEVTDDPETPDGYRRFDLWFEQPVDHAAPRGETFRQKLVLLHRSEDDPVVLQTSGYAIFGVALSEIARHFGTNQLQVEHRFFAGSVPGETDWCKLDIRQSAADFHRVALLFRQIYRGRWLNTGASKGGMTSVFHRRFFPSDLDATVADVAPLSRSDADPRYLDFVEQVGGETWAACRAALADAQQGLIDRRDEIVPAIPGTYLRLGSADAAFEHAVVEMPFTFWQYQSPRDPAAGCDAVPARGASTAELWGFLTKVLDVETNFGDGGLAEFAPYYYQAATELGSPAYAMDHLSGLRYPDRMVVADLAPPGVPATYSPASMADVNSWAKTRSGRVMYVYGEYDPWGAARFPIRPASDSFLFVEAGGNHGATVLTLSEADRAEAVETLARWLDKEPEPGAAKGGPTLEDLEREALRRLTARGR